MTVSAGVGEGLVPDVTNRTVEDATKMLEKEHFNVKVDPRQPSSSVDPDHIISTTPPIGTTPEIRHDDPSHPVVGHHAFHRSRVSPSKTRRTLLTQTGFVVRTLRENERLAVVGRRHAHQPAGRHEESQGRRPPSTCIVSTGPKLVDVPSVVGLTADEAKATLKQKGFESSVILEPTTLKGNDGKVLSQNPNQGEQAAPGSTVVLNVGSFTAPTTTTTKPKPTTTTTTTGP